MKGGIRRNSCLAQWRRRKVKGEIIHPTSNALIGVVPHRPFILKYIACKKNDYSCNTFSMLTCNKGSITTWSHAKYWWRMSVAPGSISCCSNGSFQSFFLLRLQTYKECYIINY